MILQHDIGCRDNNARRMTTTLPQAEPRTSPISGTNSSVRQPRRLAQEEQRIIIPVIEIMSGDYVISRIMDVVKLDMVFEKSSAKATVAEISMK
jgi:hypothetical protein